MRSELMDRMIRLCKETGDFIREESAGFDRDMVETKKGYSDLVSYVDKSAEKMLVDGLGWILPGAGFIAEEGTGQRSQGLNWIVDPLDGTTNFVHGLPVFAVSVALFDGEQITHGVVYEVNRDECFHAEKGTGAFMNEERIRVSEKSDLKDSLLATGFPYYEFTGMERYLMILDEFMRSTHGLRRMGSAAVDLAYTAAGRFEGFFEFNLNAWDVAAGALIVKEAGGRVTNFKGEDNFLFDREIIAAGPVQSRMLDVIKTCWQS